MNKIEAYIFVDCLLIDFNVDKTLSTLEIITEAYIPSTDSKLKKKGIIKITCSNILFLHFEKKTELDLDLQQPYEENGNDVKANELYSIHCVEHKNHQLTIVLKADFLSFELNCNRMEILEVENYKPTSD